MSFTIPGMTRKIGIESTISQMIPPKNILKNTCSNHTYSNHPILIQSLGYQKFLWCYLPLQLHYIVTLPALFPLGAFDSPYDF